ncbi:glycoside hydrolase family 3 protein [Thalassotalea fonticola]|uniref:Glycoside hydrolase family 3 protein n=1 Tax=Thalassotalea fonticola TaxID=3065649 RepID=A0ABZ0GMS6_9GAMM|nr:glycoside hydrolase family 3 protein [Colwelliaceae bacterium S1-1]
MTQIKFSKTIKEKVEKLISSMNIEQKIGQMVQVERLTCSPADVKKYHIGSVLSGAGSLPEDNSPIDWLNMVDDYWCASISADKDHLAIPIIYGADAIHGHNNVKGATIFPHNIGLGAMNDAELIERVASVTAKEVLASGIDWVFAPNLAVAQNHHWGRTYESFAETPKITTQYAPRIIKGMQNNVAEHSIIACLKHWVGDGGTAHGVDQGDTVASWSELAKTHIPPFQSALDAGALTVMASFSSWNGDKCHGHKYLLTDVLKNKMQFSGFVLSDMDAIDYLSSDFYQSIGISVNAGIDMFMLPQNWREFIEHLISHIELGTVTIERVNDAVRRILSVKIHCGLFDMPRPKHRTWANHDDFGSLAHREVAREAVRKSLVLLKNQNGILPLDKKQKILVTGKNANNLGHQCGGFTIDWQGVTGNEFIEGGTSIWQGVEKVAPNATLLSDVSADTVNSAEFDAAIVVIGECSYAEGMGDIRNGNDIIVQTGSLINGEINIIKPYGDSLELANLHPEDYQTIKTLNAKNIPIITVLISGRPLVVNKELAASNAFVSAWLPGSEGQGISDVLFGDYNFQGKLSFSWPKKAHSTSSIGDSPYCPLFSYGFGLSY